jgi:hypothetical protein
MITTKYVNYKQVLNLSGVHLILISIWCTLIAALLFFQLAMDDYSMGSRCLIGTAEAFLLVLKTTRLMTGFGKPEKSGVELSIPAVHLLMVYVCF